MYIAGKVAVFCCLPSWTLIVALQVPNDPSHPDSMSAPSAPISLATSSSAPTGAHSLIPPASVLPPTVPVAMQQPDHQLQHPSSSSSATADSSVQAHQHDEALASSARRSPDFDASFAGEAESMFTTEQGRH